MLDFTVALKRNNNYILKKNTGGGGRRGLESFWHLLGSKSRLISSKKVKKNARYYSRVLREKSTFGSKSHMVIGQKVEIWLPRSWSLSDASSSKGSRDAVPTGYRGSTYDLWRLHLGTLGALFSQHAPIISSFFLTFFIDINCDFNPKRCHKCSNPFPPPSLPERRFVSQIAPIKSSIF